MLTSGLLFLGWFSFHLASIRILRADECSNIFVAKYLVQGQAAKLNGASDLFQYLLSLLEGRTARSIDLFINARFFMLEVFWLNLVLIALATGEKLLSIKGLAALAGAATLAPLWDYGFEARNDNLVLTCVLLTWCMARGQSKLGLQSYFIAGALLVTAQFIATKALVYTLPIAALVLLFPPPSAIRPRGRLALAWAAGALIACLLLLFLYHSKGLWGAGRRSISGLTAVSIYTAPWHTLARLLTQTPLLLAVLMAAAVRCFSDLRQNGRAVLNWEGYFPEAGLFMVSLTALFLNPSPYPYNLLHFVPYAFIFAWRYGASIVQNLTKYEAMLPSFVSLLLFANLVPFAMAARRQAHCLNYRQEQLMTLAESLTDPSKDAVYDGIGMVPTRPMVSSRSAIQSPPNQDSLTDSALDLRDALTGNPPAVVIQSYRTDWLAAEDRTLVKDRYVPLSDDFWVLGKILAAGGGTFEIFHAGRYRISTLRGSDLSDTYPLGLAGLLSAEDPGTITGTLDGVALSNHPVQLTVGVHRIECTADIQPAVVWLGPRLERVHRIGPGDHQVLFQDQ